MFFSKRVILTPVILMRFSMKRMAAGWIAAAIFLSVPVQASEPVIDAENAILIDGKTRRVLFSKSPSERSLIASTTKIMTALLVIEDCDLSAQVAVPPEAIDTEGSSMHLELNEICSVEELLYGLMLHSGNDSAVALAMYHSGSISSFAEKMNDKAAELGLLNTHFQNPHGLDAENHYSTAEDLAKLAAFAMDNPVFYRIVSTKSIQFGDRTMTNHNKLLWQYPGAVGVKTGYTKAAGRILVSAAERDGRRFIAVTINDRNDWEDHAELLNYGFEQYHPRMIAFSGQTMASVPVLCGSEDVQAVLREEIWVSLADAEHVELRLNLPPLVHAPVLAGDLAGSVLVMVDCVLVEEFPLYWRYSVFEEA